MGFRVYVHYKKMNKIWILFVIAVVIFIAGSMYKESKLNDTTINKPTKLEFGKPFVVDDISITFQNIIFTDEFRYNKADRGYNFAIVDFKAKNVGFKKEYFPFYFSSNILKVDKGYEYNYLSSSSTIPIELRPEDVEFGYLVFEILKSTNPTELYLKKYNKEVIISISQNNYRGCDSGEFLRLNKNNDWFCSSNKPDLNQFD